MAAPTILVHGTEEQKKRYLRPLFTCEEIWCQLFSEPGAGSDVASLATRAIKDGDEWIVNGQKVWTTLAHTASFGLLIARTDPEAPKHRGMTYFVVDMHAPGVEVRPLRQMTGDAEFNEVFFTDVRIPDAERLDAVGAGWRVAMTTLMNERVAIGGGVPARSSGPIQEAMRHLEGQGRQAPRRARPTHASVGRVRGGPHHQHAGTRAAPSGHAGTRRVGGKAQGGRAQQGRVRAVRRLDGMEGTLYSGHYEMRRPERPTFGAGGDVRHAFLRSRANSIEGGTSEIMRNILGERVLGLPGDPRNDKDLPWSEVPRN